MDILVYWLEGIVLSVWLGILYWGKKWIDDYFREDY